MDQNSRCPSTLSTQPASCPKASYNGNTHQFYGCSVKMILIFSYLISYTTVCRPAAETVVYHLTTPQVWHHSILIICQCCNLNTHSPLCHHFLLLDLDLSDDLDIVRWKGCFLLKTQLCFYLSDYLFKHCQISVL